jgi:hypothetical protein
MSHDSDAKFAQQFLDSQVVMRGNVFEQAAKQANFQGPMVWHSDVMFAAAPGGHLDLRTGLACGFVTQPTECAG